MEKVLKIDRENPDSNLLREAGELIRKGEVIAFPTETFYGLGVDALNPRAVEKIFDIKGRSRRSPILALVHDAGKISGLARSIPPQARPLMDRFWPGPLTLVFEAYERVPVILTGGTGKIGIRIPSDPLTLLFLKAACTPVTATSANRSGQPSPCTAEEVLEQLGEEVFCILDAGPTPGGPPSTVVDVTTQPVTLLREGRISAAHIRSEWLAFQ